MDPEPPTVAVVELADVFAMRRTLLLVETQLVKLNPGFGLAEIATVAPALYHAVPDGIVEPCPSGVEENVTWYWF